MLRAHKRRFTVYRLQIITSCFLSVDNLRVSPLHEHHNFDDVSPLPIKVLTPTIQITFKHQSNKLMIKLFLFASFCLLNLISYKTREG